MSEPTAEQVDAETQAAKRLVKSILRDLEDRRGVGNELEAIDKDTRKELEDTLGGIAATALARVRIEALEACEKVAHGKAAEQREQAYGIPFPEDRWTRLRLAEECDAISDAIRALRGRT